jgi:fused signal recognition particle receptor
MLLVIIVVACAAFVLLAGVGTFTALSRGRSQRSLERGAEAKTRPPALKAPPGRPAAPTAPPRRAPVAAPPEAGPPAEAEAATEVEAVEVEAVEVEARVEPEAPPAPEAAPEVEGPPEIEVVAEIEVLPEAEPEAGLEGPEVLERPRFRDRLGRARSLLADQLAGLRRRGKLDQESWDELEEALILADVGITTTEVLLKDLKDTARRENLATPEQLVGALREELVGRLEGERELHLAEDGKTTVWLFVGVNGVGKTTTIGKVAMQEEQEGTKVVLAAGDTFRAAAADQLGLWAERVSAGFVRGNEGGDPGAVVFDAVQHANARGIPLVLADTAGRLHTKVNLMEELKKVRRVADRPPGSVTEVLLVIDATTGQNGLIQARQFTDAVGVTGVVLTKLDGTAKGGIVIAIASELGIPIKLVGLGEGPEDLVAFDAQEFVDALLPAD